MNVVINYKMFNCYSMNAKQQRKLSAPTINKNKNYVLEGISSSRKLAWIQQNIHSDVANALINGANPFINIEQHQFREYTPYANIYVRKYMPEKERVMATAVKYFNGHYVKEPYCNTPSIDHSCWTRKRLPHKELGISLTYENH
jgi:hypothetical protein